MRDSKKLESFLKEKEIKNKQLDFLRNLKTQRSQKMILKENNTKTSSNSDPKTKSALLDKYEKENAEANQKKLMAMSV
jgi:hypothetical protein